MGTAVAFRAVSKRYQDGTQALADATWTVEEGVAACLLGPRGSGKTTSIRLIEGVIRPTGGSVSVLGAVVGSQDFPYVRQRVGVVPQTTGMYADLTADEYISMAARLHGVQPQAAIEAMGLAEHLHARMLLLPAGLQRRLALAAALVADPDLLILDEPTYGPGPACASLPGAICRPWWSRWRGWSEASSRRKAGCWSTWPTPRPRRPSCCGGCWRPASRSTSAARSPPRSRTCSPRSSPPWRRSSSAVHPTGTAALLEGGAPADAQPGGAAERAPPAHGAGRPRPGSGPARRSGPAGPDRAPSSLPTRLPGPPERG